MMECPCYVGSAFTFRVENECMVEKSTFMGHGMGPEGSPNLGFTTEGFSGPSNETKYLWEATELKEW